VHPGAHLLQESVMQEIPVIVVTGGPQSGVSKILPFLKAEFERHGYAVQVISETEAELAPEYQTPMSDSLTYQMLMLQKRIELEEIAIHRFQSLTKKKVIFVEGGVLDDGAHALPEIQNQVWNGARNNIVELRDARYAGILHLKTRERSLEAETSCERTLAAWIGTPHLGYINTRSGLKETISRSITWAHYFLGEIENEKKWKVLIPYQRSLLPEHAQCIDIHQSYVDLPGEPKQHRIRQRGQRGYNLYFQTMKTALAGMSCTEVDPMISKLKYESLLEGYLVPGHAEVVKKRMCFVERDTYFELDIFRDLPGKILLEAETPDPTWEIPLPSFLDGEGKVIDVTGDPAHMNRAYSKEIAALQLAA
jgi:hypothetical protein